MLRLCMSRVEWIALAVLTVAMSHKVLEVAAFSLIVAVDVTRVATVCKDNL